MRLRRILTGAAALGLIAAGAIVTPASAADPTSLTGSGSSFVNKYLTTCAVGYKHRVRYNPAGSGTGRSNFRDGLTDFGGSDAANDASIFNTRKGVYVPVVGGPIAMLTNVPELGTTAIRFTPEVIARIYRGDIKTWNDNRIKALQPAAVASKLPNRPIRVVYRATNSGTSDNFTNYLAQTSPTLGWTRNGTIITASPNKRMPGGALGVPNATAMTTTVAKTKYAIGYADLGDSIGKKVGLAVVQNANGEWVAPSSASSAKFLAEFYDDKDVNKTTGEVRLDFTKKVAGGYNLVAIVYYIAPTNDGANSKADATKEFATHLLSGCGKAEATGYTPITGEAKKVAEALIARIG